MRNFYNLVRVSGDEGLKFSYDDSLELLNEQEKTIVDKHLTEMRLIKASGEQQFTFRMDQDQNGNEWVRYTLTRTVLSGTEMLQVKVTA